MREIKDMNKEDLKKYKRYRRIYSKYFCDFLNLESLNNLHNVVKQDFYLPYIKLIKNTASLLDKLDLNNVEEDIVAFNYLLWNGYFSHDKHLEFNNKNRINVPCAYGADVMLGKSVCLNNAELLSRVLNEKGVDAYLISCYMKSQNIWDIVLEQEIVEHNNSLKQKIVGNHAVTLVENNNKYFLADPTNLEFYNFNGFLKAEDEFKTTKLNIKPYDLPCFGVNYEKLNEIVYNTYINSDKKVVDCIRVITPEYVRKVLEKCKDNKSLLDDYYDNSVKDIEKVCKTLIKK